MATTGPDVPAQDSRRLTPKTPLANNATQAPKPCPFFSRRRSLRRAACLPVLRKPWRAARGRRSGWAGRIAG